MMIASSVLWLVAVVFGIPLLIFTIELVIGFRRLRNLCVPEACSTAVLIPAHNEGQGIRATIDALLKIAPPGCRIVVVADNCSDDTAAAARTDGVEVIERSDRERRGKGFALDFGRAYLAKDPPDAVIVVDADCRVRPGSIERLATVAFRTGQPAQGVNTLEPDLAAAPLVQVSSFSFLVKNLIRARGIFRWGGVTLLTGTGMAFPWVLFRDAALATDNIVEDLALGVELTRMGHHTRLVCDAGVTSPSAQREHLLEQRARWERGFLAVARKQALPLLGHGIRTRSRACIALGLHLLVPPLAMLIAISTIGLVGLAIAVPFGAPAGPAVALGLALTAAGVATVAAWVLEGRSTLSPLALLIAPSYVLWKIPMYLKFLRNAPTKWLRTPRPEGARRDETGAG